jgi:hypothetical protein
MPKSRRPLPEEKERGRLPKRSAFETIALLTMERRVRMRHTCGTTPSGCACHPSTEGNSDSGEFFDVKIDRTADIPLCGGVPRRGGVVLGGIPKSRRIFPGEKTRGRLPARRASKAILRGRDSTNALLTMKRRFCIRHACGTTPSGCACHPSTEGNSSLCVTCHSFR